MVLKDSTGHGYPNILRTKRNVVRLMWSVFFLSSAAFCSYLVVRGILAYMQNEVTSKIRLVNKSSLTFPMITLCNSKPFMTRSAYDYTIEHFLKLNDSNNQYVESDQLKSVLFGNYTNSSSIANFLEYSGKDVYLFQNQLADPSFNQTLLSAIGLTRDEFFLFKTYDGSSLSNDYVVPYYDPYYGNCFTINSGLLQNGSGIPLLSQAGSGEANGLILINFIDVFVNQSYNFMNLLNSYGFGLKISIDDQDDVPLLFN